VLDEVISTGCKAWVVAGKNDNKPTPSCKFDWEYNAMSKMIVRIDEDEIHEIPDSMVLRYSKNICSKEKIVKINRMKS